MAAELQELQRIRRTLELELGRASEREQPRARSRLPYIASFRLAPLPAGAAGDIASGGYVIDASTLPTSFFGSGGTVTEDGLLSIDLEQVLGMPSTAGHVLGIGDPVPDLLLRCRGIGDAWTGWYRVRTGDRFAWAWPTTEVQIANVGTTTGIAQVLAQ